MNDINKKPQLLAIDGGLSDNNENWLKDLAAGTVFLCRMKDQKTVDVQEYHVVFQDGDYTKLFSNLNKEINMWVDTLMFSRNFTLAKVIGNNG